MKTDLEDVEADRGCFTLVRQTTAESGKTAVSVEPYKLFNMSPSCKYDRW